MNVTKGTVTVTSGEFAPANGASFNVTGGTVSISGGTFIGADGKVSVNGGDATKFISGGSFNVKPDVAYIVETNE